MAEPKAGSIAEFGFGNRATLFRMRIADLKPPSRVVWECLGEVDEWKGTRLIWELSRHHDRSKLKFTHADWQAITGWFATCNTTWGAFMHRLMDYAEGKNPGPLFKGC